MDWLPVSDEKKTVRMGGWEVALHWDGAPDEFDEILPLDGGENAESPKHIDLYYQLDAAGSFRQKFDECAVAGEKFVPEPIAAFYRILEELEVSHLPLEQHCNSYHRFGEYILADFPYESDRFFLVCSPADGRVWLFGDAHCVRRVILDLQHISWPVLALHGSAAEKNGKATCVLGNTKSGKSFVLQILLKYGWSYMADDALFITDGTVHRRDFSIETREREEKETISSKVGGYPMADAGSIGRVWVLKDLSGKDFIQWFPCVAKQSFWWLVMADFTAADEAAMREKVVASVELVKRMISRGEKVRLDLAEATRQLLSEDASYDATGLFLPVG